MASKKTQVQKFREMARELDVELTPERFDATLKHVAKYKPSSDAKDGRTPAKAPSPRKKR